MRLNRTNCAGELDARAEGQDQEDREVVLEGSERGQVPAEEDRQEEDHLGRAQAGSRRHPEAGAPVREPGQGAGQQGEHIRTNILNLSSGAIY